MHHVQIAVQGQSHLLYTLMTMHQLIKSLKFFDVDSNVYVTTDEIYAHQLFRNS